MTIEHVNAQSLLGNMDVIRLLVEERNTDVLCVSESWLAPNSTDDFVKLPGYKIFRRDGGRGGGVCIYVKDILTTNVINFNAPRQEGVEDLWVTVQCRKLPSIIVGCVYRHPKAPVTSFNYIQDTFKMIVLKNKALYVLGDFNDNLLDKDNKMSRLIKASKLTQLVNKPTRITHTSSTLLDLIITNKPSSVLICDVVPQEIADHDLVGITVDVNKPKRLPMIKTFRHLGKYTKEDFCFKILESREQFNKILYTDDVNRQVEIFTSNFIKCLDDCAPYVTKEIKRPFAPWMTDHLQEIIKLKNETRKKLRFDRQNAALQDQYKREKKQIKTLIDESKNKYYSNKLNENKGNVAKTWKTIR